MPQLINVKRGVLESPVRLSTSLSLEISSMLLKTDREIRTPVAKDL